MAKFVAYDQVDLQFLLELGHLADTGSAKISHRSSHGVTVTQGNVEFFFKGSGIKYFGGYPYDGTLTGLLVAVDGVNSYKFSDFDYSVGKAYDVFGTKDPVKAAAKVFSGDDTIKGSDFDDTLPGFNGSDVIKGRGGHDTIRGDNGRDALFGGDGDDLLRGGKARDNLDGGNGTDTADFSDKHNGITVTLDGANTVNATIDGKVEDTLRNIENVTGGNQKDFLTGDANANRLDGREGGDVLNGGAGNDLLIGGEDKDHFVFNTAIADGNNVDTIVGFTPGEDVIELASAIFGMVAGALSATALAIGGDATTADQRIVYDSSNGGLYYDSDGSGAGAKVQFALVSAGLPIAATDFMVV